VNADHLLCGVGDGQLLADVFLDLFKRLGALRLDIGDAQDDWTEAAVDDRTIVAAVPSRLPKAASATA
jgi:hypothetical protein